MTPTRMPTVTRLPFRAVLFPVLTVLGVTAAAAGQMQKPLPAATPPPGLTIAVLDSLKRLPGGLSALPAPPIPRDNPQTRAKIELGRLLFFDKRLSRDRSTSCATCHDPDKAYSDGRARAVGIGHAILSRRAPSLLNGAYNSSQFWDGRARSLEEQALAPMLSAKEMGMADPKALLARLQGVPEYSRRFSSVFGRAVNLLDIERAIAAFERTLVTPGAAFDRYAEGDKQALTDQQKRGLILYIGKASCSQCHSGPNFTDNKFHSLGLLPGQSDDDDPGHFAVTKNPADLHAFKTPSLRDATDESRFMHNGAIATLADVIEFYNQGGGRGTKSSLLFKLDLTADEKDDLLAFLHSLAGRVRGDHNLTRGSGSR
jgi:cytochrome c peroxidase